MNSTLADAGNPEADADELLNSAPADDAARHAARAISADVVLGALDDQPQLEG
jgi:hypothetical protein